MLLVTDEQFSIRYISSSVLASFGVQSYSMIGRNAFDFVNESNREPWRKCLEETNCNMRSEISFVTPDGKDLHFDATITNHVSNSEIRGLVVMMFDITETKKRRTLLEKTNHHLDHFIYKTIHDLKAPVQSALSLMELTSLTNAEERERHFSMVKCNLRRMEDFIEEVSNYYKNEKMGIVTEPIQFDELVRDEIQSMQNLPGAKDIRFEYNYSGGELLSDPLRIKTILTNILSNSIKYSDRFKDDKFIEVSVDVNESVCELIIRDNGMGIPDEYQQKIFDMFFRYHTQIHGTGLGLYIVQDSVARLGGKISVFSKLGDGTTFTVTIPNRAEILEAEPIARPVL
jgi:hypothetical protein